MYRKLRMSSKKSNGSKKDPSKTPKVWERARREKMKIYFNELQEVLPFYDPSAPMSRFEILQKSKTYIKDLQDQNQDLLNGGFDEVYRIKMSKLKHRVKELIKRVDQLTDLLKTANIMIPPLESYQEGSKSTAFKWMSQHPKKWTEKINLVVPDDKIKNILTLIKDYKKNSNKIKLKKKQLSKNIEKSETTSEASVQKTKTKRKKVLRKKCKVINLKSIKTGKSETFPGSQSPSQFKENQPVDFNLLCNNVPSSKSIVSDENNPSSAETSKSDSKSTSNKVTEAETSSISKVTIPQNVILPSVPNVLSPNTFILTNNGSLVQLPIINSSRTVLNQNSSFLTSAAVVKQNGQLITPLVINKPPPVLVLQKPSPQIFQTAQIISATPQIIATQSGVQLLDTTKVYTAASTAAKSLPHILSKTPANKKRIARDSTVTTYVNKIPIPAPSKLSYVKKSVSLSPKKDAGFVKPKNSSEKNLESLNINKVDENRNEKQNTGENVQVQNDKTSVEVVEKEKEKSVEPEPSLGGSEKRILEESEEVHKKAKLDENLLTAAEDNVFKPIENDTAEVFCNLGLPNAINPSLSVSPTAAFLSSFPIVAPTRSETEEEVTEKKSDEGKDLKTNEEQPVGEKNKENKYNSKEEANVQLSKDLTKGSTDNADIQIQMAKEKLNATTSEQTKFFPSRDFTTNNINTNVNKNNLVHQQVSQFKSWEQFHQETAEAFYMPSDTNIHVSNSGGSVGINPPALSYSASSENTYKNYSQNTNLKTNINLQNNITEQVALESNHFEYLQKENYMNKVATYSNERTLPAKPCTNNVNESYDLAKTQPSNYEIDSGPNYQLIPAKELPNQRNSRTVNWMTEPDISNRVPAYGSQSDKMMTAKPPTFSQHDHFYVNNRSTKITNDCTGHFIISDQNKTNYQKNDFYGKDQRCKNVEKRAENKCYNKTQQNSYNIFDYNYSPSCYGDESSSKYCQNQYSGKVKKTITQPKKKSDVHQVNELTSELSKRLPDHTITTMDFNSVANQECFTWVPGKNVEWLPSKSFGLDTNLIVPSTLPTLVGDLALGTTSTNDPNQKSVATSKPYRSNLKSNVNDINKDYVDITMGSSSVLPKPAEAVDTNKQYFEPFANLSKNIFDVTNTNMNNSQIPKNDYDKINFAGNNNSNETIVLKNIFELPVSKSSGGDFSRNKQRTINNPQNTFLSVSQLVEPSGFDGNSIKADSQDSIPKVDPYNQNYPTYINQKAYKNKARSTHCKFNDRKYHGYKNSGTTSSNSSSSYTAEALIRSNSNVNYQPNEFSADVGINFFNTKPSQKPEQCPGNNKIDFEINTKSDFSTTAGQNIYSDFNFSSPVPNFAIGATVGTDFGNHESSGNFSAQNNSFFGDFVTPEYSLSDNVSNSLLLPQCSIGLQNPFVIDKRSSVPMEKNKTNSKQFTRNRKHYDCTKTTFNEFSITPTSAIFTTSSIACPPIFTTSACQNLLPVPTQSIPISFSSPSFSTGNIPFPPLSSATSNYHRFPNSSQNQASGSFLSSNTMFTTCTTKPLSSHNCYSSSPLTSVTNSVISSFPVGNVSLSSSSQSGIPFFSLSNPIIPSSAPTSTSNSLANFNLSTIFPEINQKGNYHYS